jgi:hypothetical protein
MKIPDGPKNLGGIVFIMTAEAEGVVATVGDGERAAEAELPADGDAALERGGSDVAEVVSL